MFFFNQASMHCEIVCIEQLKKENIKLNELVLFVTVEPCIMCAYALNLISKKI